MIFGCSKMKICVLCFEKEKEKEISFEMGLAPHFAAHP
jgi:hypothetical protein